MSWQDEFDELGVNASGEDLVEDWISGPECCRTCMCFAYLATSNGPIPGFREPSDATRGTCRYYPPQVMMHEEDGQCSGQPETIGGGWCAKYERGEPHRHPKR